jgi:type II secretory pathway component PulK
VGSARRVSNTRDPEAGVALLIAVVATALLTITVFEFTYATQVSYRRAVHWLQAKRAKLAAASGITLASEVLSFDGQLADLVKSGSVPDEVKGLIKGFDPRLAATDGFMDVWARCSDPGPWSCVREVGSECTMPLSGARQTAGPGGASSSATDDPAGYFTVRIDDETGLYNVNRLVSHNINNEWERVSRILRLADLKPALAGPMVDWVDRDTIPLATPPGAEATQYTNEKLEPVPRNGPMATFRELGLVMGFGPEELRKARKVFSVLPAPIDKVNVNTAPLPVLQGLGDSLIDDTLLAELHAQRCLRPFINEADLLARVPEIEKTGIKALLTYSSNWFLVRSTAHVGDITQSAEALLFRQGADIEPVYFVARRGANIETIDTSVPSGFETQMPRAGAPPGQS